MNAEDLLKKIDEKIAELDKMEDANELLRRSLLRKGIIKEDNNLTDKKIESLFEIIKDNLN